MTAHRITPRRRAEDSAFLAMLRRTGNARLAARELGVHRSTYTKRRARDPAFAAEWDAALAAFEAAPEPGRDGRSQPLVLTRLKSGRVQLRRLRPGTIGPAEEAAFLTALAASANVRLSAAAAGFAHSSFYARRDRLRAFAREMRAALAHACTNLETELLAAALPERLECTAWRDNDPPPIPRMTVDQALQLLHLHHNSVQQGWAKPHRRKRRGESWDLYTRRLTAMWMAEQRMEREDEEARRALQNRSPASLSRHPGLDPGSVFLPSLDQVTGWSKAKPHKSSGAGRKAARTSGRRVVPPQAARTRPEPSSRA